jgi:hypothetical protein
MKSDSLANWLLYREARALLSRLERLEPMVLRETMVPAAALSPAALLAIESFLVRGREHLERQIRGYLAWLASDEGQRATPERCQHRFTFLKLRFNAVLTQLDIFSEAMSQRSEAQTGVWLAGLDVVAADALAMPELYAAPPVVCHLARDAGGAIRRARTRLPGGGENPVAIVRLPRERMIGFGVASSLVHEVGHQAAALLDLVPGLRLALTPHPADGPRERTLWSRWSRWVSEIAADAWAVGRVGVASTLGLMGLVSLPRAFVFRNNLDGVHPTPWIRVKLSCALGAALYPHPRWGALGRVWEQLYPLDRLPSARAAELRALEAAMPRFIERLLGYRAPALDRSTLGEVLLNRDLPTLPTPSQSDGSRTTLANLSRLRPTLALASLGLARLSGALTPEADGALLATLLETWAVSATLQQRRPLYSNAALPAPALRPRLQP